MIASLHPDWTPGQVNENIRETCDSLQLPHACAGHGVINCARAVESVAEKPLKETVVKSKTVERIEVRSEANKIFIEIELKK